MSQTILVIEPSPRTTARIAEALAPLGYESLMDRNWDEPFGLYGLLAESVETGPNREWVEFDLLNDADIHVPYTFESPLEVPNERTDK